MTGPLTTVRRGPPLVVLAVITTAWALAVGAELTGHARELHHGALIEGGLPFGVALLLFVLAWQVMIAAMMLPSSLPLVRGFRVVAAGQPAPGRALAAFLGGYAVVWTVFGAAAFTGDLAVHRTVDAVPWLAAHPWLIAGGVLGIAGVFQFSSLKDRCLRECRSPGAFLLRHYRRRGAGAAFRLGGWHGVFCVGCCWALMLVMFAAGVANLWWMAALTALMVFEKTAPTGRRGVSITGVVLLVLAALVLAHPGWLPPVFGGEL